MAANESGGRWQGGGLGGSADFYINLEASSIFVDMICRLVVRFEV